MSENVSDTAVRGETSYQGYDGADDNPDSSVSSGGYGTNAKGDAFARANQGVDPGSFADAKPQETNRSGPPTRVGSTASLMALPQGMDYSQLNVLTDDAKNKLTQEQRDALSEKAYGVPDRSKGEHIGG